MKLTSSNVCTLTYLYLKEVAGVQLVGDLFGSPSLQIIFREFKWTALHIFGRFEDSWIDEGRLDGTFANHSSFLIRLKQLIGKLFQIYYKFPFYPIKILN